MLFPVAIQAAEQPLILGILEEQAHSLGYSAKDGKPAYSKTTYSREVRVAFLKDGQGWKAFPANAEGLQPCYKDCDGQFLCGNKNSCDTKANIGQCRIEKQKNCNSCFSNCSGHALEEISQYYPTDINWNIVLDGKNLGSIEGKMKNPLKYFSEVGLQDIVESTPIPTIGNRSRDFSGFLSEPVYRPLVAVSQPNFKDTESWKPSKLSPNLAKLVRQQFRKKFPEASNCVDVNDAHPKPWAYKDNNIKIIATYNSQNHWSMVQAKLDIYRCDFALEDKNDPFIGQWFAISPANDVIFLDAGMWLVDAGDYDNNGKSELIFAIDRYNRGGYELFYDDFKKHAEFQFRYH